MKMIYRWICPEDFTIVHERRAGYTRVLLPGVILRQACPECGRPCGLEFRLIDDPPIVPILEPLPGVREER